jgi:hypothetical protein
MLSDSLVMFAGLPGLHSLLQLVRDHAVIIVPWLDGFFKGPLAGFVPLLSLRTNKADIVVGVKKELAEQFDNSGERWRVNGR